MRPTLARRGAAPQRYVAYRLAEMASTNREPNPRRPLEAGDPRRDPRAARRRRSGASAYGGRGGGASAIAKTTIYRRWRDEWELALDAVLIEMLPRFDDAVDLGDTCNEPITFINSVVKAFGSAPYGTATQAQSWRSQPSRSSAGSRQRVRARWLPADARASSRGSGSACGAVRRTRSRGSLLVKRVLVTGATGGVGQYAVQLAALAGAHVTALVRDVAKDGAQLRSLGAATVVDAVDGRFDTVVDAVGGTTLAAAIERMAPPGLIVNVATDLADETVSFRAAHFDRAPRATIYTFNLFDESSRMDAAGDLARLVTLRAQEKLAAPRRARGRLAGRRPRDRRAPEADDLRQSCAARARARAKSFQRTLRHDAGRQAERVQSIQSRSTRAGGATRRGGDCRDGANEGEHVRRGVPGSALSSDKGPLVRAGNP